MTERLSRLFLFWFPALLWTAVVLLASNEAWSAAQTGSYVRGIVNLVAPGLDPAAIEIIHKVIRKSAHVCEYGILGLLYLRAQRGRNAGYEMRWSFVALAVCLAVASLDEWHQSFIPTRTGTWHDVLIDVTGAIAFQMAAAARLRRRAVHA
jgi:VanZ family protein